MQGDFHLGDFLVQPQLNQISMGDQSHSIEPKVMDVLVYLAEHAGEVIPKERIIQAVWPDTFVTDEVLTNAISDLRKAFGDDAKNPAIIQTIPRRGYRLMAPVSVLEGGHEALGEEVEPEGPSVETTAPSWWRSGTVIGAGAALLAIVLVLWWHPFTPPGKSIDSIAVLPFVNTGGDTESEYLSGGISASISLSLSQLPGLRVIPTSALGRYRCEEVDPLLAADELRVRAVLAGTLSQIGDTLLVRVELVDSQEKKLLWGEQYKRKFADIFAMQEEVAEQIAGALRLQLSDEVRQRLRKRYTENDEAHEAYLKGQYLMDQGDRKKAIEYFELVLEEDPGFALAQVELANRYWNLGWQTASAEPYQRARVEAEKALRMDDTLGEAHYLMAQILAFYDHNWIAAGESFKRAAQLNPKQAGLKFWVQYLLWMGRHDEAVAVLQLYKERIDPLSALQRNLVAWISFLAHEYDQAIEEGKRALELDPKFHDSLPVVLSYEQKGMYEQAFQALLSGQRRRFGAAQIKSLEQAYEESGMKGVWRLMSQRGHHKPYDKAAFYAHAGETDQAFEWLERAFLLPVMVPVVTDARFDSLRDDPRYEQFLHKLNLPKEVIARHLAD